MHAELALCQGLSLWQEGAVEKVGRDDCRAFDVVHTTSWSSPLHTE